MQPKNIPFEFVLDNLASSPITVKAVFGMFYLYMGKRIVLIFRKRAKDTQLNGIWVATQPFHHKNLIKELPALCLFSACGGKDESGWLLLPEHALDFEETALQICRVV